MLVNDGSTDGTGDIADRLVRELPHSRTIHHPGNLGIGAGGARPDVTGSIGYPKSVDEWFNPNAFETPAVLSFGSAGRGILRGPGRANFNLSLFKSFTMPFPGNPEGAKLQFRAEAFNAFNHTQFHGVDTGFGGQNFSKVTSTYDPRVWQLGLKFLF